MQGKRLKAGANKSMEMWLCLLATVIPRKRSKPSLFFSKISLFDLFWGDYMDYSKFWGDYMDSSKSSGF